MYKKRTLWAARQKRRDYGITLLTIEHSYIVACLWPTYSYIYIYMYFYMPPWLRLNTLSLLPKSVVPWINNISLNYSSRFPRLYWPIELFRCTEKGIENASIYLKNIFIYFHSPINEFILHLPMYRL